MKLTKKLPKTMSKSKQLFLEVISALQNHYQLDYDDAVLVIGSYIDTMSLMKDYPKIEASVLNVLKPKE